MQLSPPAIPQQSLFTHSEHSWIKVESASPLHVLQPGEALQRLTHQRKIEKRNSHQPDRRLIIFSSGCLREIKAGLWCSSAVGSVLRWLAGPDSPAFVSQRCPLPRPDSHSHRDSALDLQRWQWPHFDSHPPAPSLIGPRTCRSLRHGARIESAPAGPSRAGLQPPLRTVIGPPLCHSFYISVSPLSRGNPRLLPAWEKREQITTTQLPVNEAVAMVGSQRLRAADCYLNGYTSVRMTNVAEVRSHSPKQKSSLTLLK